MPANGLRRSGSWQRRLGQRRLGARGGTAPGLDPARRPVNGWL